MIGWRYLYPLLFSYNPYMFDPYSQHVSMLSTVLLTMMFTVSGGQIHPIPQGYSLYLKRLHLLILEWWIILVVDCVTNLLYFYYKMVTQSTIKRIHNPNFELV